MENLSESSPRVTEIAIVALWRRAGGGIEVLVTRRPQGVHLAGSWELPGGKIGPEEAPMDAAAREAAEETGLSIIRGRLAALPQVLYRYPDRTIRLHAFLGEVAPECVVRPEGVVEFQWIPASQLAEVPFPPANGPMTAAITRALAAVHAGSAGVNPPDIPPGVQRTVEE